MTIRDFMNTVIAANVSEDITNFAKAEIEKMDAKNAKRKAAPSKAAKENVAVIEEIISTTTPDTIFTAAEVAKARGITPQKASGILTTGVKMGKFVETEPVKVKSGKVKGYKIAE